MKLAGSRTERMQWALALMLACSVTDSVAKKPEVAYMALDLKAGVVISDAFSRTIAIEAPGFDPNVRRVSGTASYKFTRVNSGTGAYEFACSYNYDGLQSGENQGQILERGRVQCYDGKCAPVTDASGVIVNPEFWGELPSNAHVGTSWVVELKTAWELGPPGKQEVTVISLDPANHLVVLTGGALYFATPAVHLPDGMFDATVGQELSQHSVLSLDFHDMKVWMAD